MQLLAKQRVARLLLVGVAVSLLALLFSGTALGADAQVNEAERWGLNMPESVTDIGKEIYDLHMLIFWICVWIGVVVFGIMFYSMVMHTRAAGYEPAKYHDNTKLEILWTVIPFIILIGMAIPSTYTLIDIYDNSEAEIDIKVVGHQWKWEYHLGPGWYRALSGNSQEGPVLRGPSIICDS